VRRRYNGSLPRLLRARRERPCRDRAAEQRDELASPQLIKFHSILTQRGLHRRIADWHEAVSGAPS